MNGPGLLVRLAWASKAVPEFDGGLRMPIARYKVWWAKTTKQRTKGRNRTSLTSLPDHRPVFVYYLRGWPVDFCTEYSRGPMLRAG